jgi:hypothetical protein
LVPHSRECRGNSSGRCAIVDFGVAEHRDVSPDRRVSCGFWARLRRYICTANPTSDTPPHTLPRATDADSPALNNRLGCLVVRESIAIHLSTNFPLDSAHFRSEPPCAILIAGASPSELTVEAAASLMARPNGRAPESPTRWGLNCYGPPAASTLNLPPTGEGRWQ